MKEKNLSVNKFEGIKNIGIDKNAFWVNEGFCKDYHEKLIKIVENKSIFDGTISFHIIKLKCPKCGKEYLDLDQAEKYDFALILEKAVKQPLNKLSSKILTN